MNTQMTTKLPTQTRAFQDALIQDGLPPAAARRIVQMFAELTISEPRLTTILRERDSVVTRRLSTVQRRSFDETASLRSELSEEISSLKVNQAGLALKVAVTLIGLFGAFLGAIAASAKLFGLLT